MRYDERAAAETERAYLTPEVARQRAATLAALAPRPGERVLDVGCGPGLLTRELALAVGPGGAVVGVDESAAMVERARERCRDLAQVSLLHAGARDLSRAGEGFAAAACVQVLLYVGDVRAVLAEIHRVLAPGARLAVIETDWRGLVLASADDALTRTLFAAWDDAVPNPWLPTRLGPLLRERGFGGVRVGAIPILGTSAAPDTFAGGMVRWTARQAVERGAVDEETARGWLADLEARDAGGGFLFCVNRFLFTARRT